MMTRASLVFAMGALSLTAALATLTGFAQTGSAEHSSDAAPKTGVSPEGFLGSSGHGRDGGTAPELGRPELEPDEEEGPEANLLPRPSRALPPLARATPLPPEKDLLLQARAGPDGRLRVPVNGREETLTIERGLQERITQLLQSYRTPYAAVVALEPSSGRVLAMAEHSQASPALRGLATRALFPAASIFKIVTAAALLEAGLTPSTTECSYGGKRRVSAQHLEDSRHDRVCRSLTQALAHSANAIFAKFTHKYLSAEALERSAEAFHFNTPIRFPLPLEVSAASIPDEPLALAQTGAGFGDVFLSPLHGALLASVAANGGVWREPVLLERWGDAGREVGPEPKRVLSPRHAAELTRMMEATVTEGTARRVFRERGHQVQGAVGKTGSLADKSPFRDYSWFVGFAPKDNPRVAVAAVVVNELTWRIRATWLGRETMRYALDLPSRPGGRARDTALSVPARGLPARSR